MLVSIAAAFRTIANNHPNIDLFMHTGDIFYGDITTNIGIM
jgi:hypothetical protein